MLGILGIAMTAGALSAALFSPQWPYPAILIVCALFGAVAIGWNGVYLAEVARVAKPELAAVATGSLPHIRRSCSVFRFFYDR
jgi:hypothetical protein